MVFPALNHHIKSLQRNILFASTLLLRAIAAHNIACYSELRPQSFRLQSSERYLVAVAAMGRYRYCGHYHRYLLPCE